MQRHLIVAALVVLTLAGTGIFLWQGDAPAAPEQAPAIAFPLIDGGRVELGELRGRPVIVHFWATTCRECRREIPDLRALYLDLNPQGLEFIAVAMPYDPPNRVLEVAEQAPLPYPVALDIDGNAVRVFGDVSLTPTTFLISPEGEIVFRKTGPLDFDKLRGDIRKLFTNQQQATGNKPLVASRL